jgi:predicted nuclease with RNAse H fold
MSKSRIPSARSKARGKSTVKTTAKSASITNNHKNEDVVRFAGISLSGGKADKSCLVIIDYYPKQQKIFLSRLMEKIKAEEFISADLKIHEILTQYQDTLESVAFDVPLSLPKCLRCEKVCPGYESCQEPEIKFMRHLYQAEEEKKKPKKMFTPYTQRCIEALLAFEYGDEIDIQPALGANLAPLTARGAFIQRRIKLKTIEVYPRLTVYKLGLQLKVNRSQLKVYRNSVGGEEARRVILSYMVDKLGIFIYQQDLKNMIENLHSFEAFISAYTALLAFEKKTAVQPADFPKNENWIEVPL